MHHRPMFHTLLKRLKEPRRFIQVLAGPRQTGKITIARQVTDDNQIPHHYASADEPTLQSRAWIEQQWETGRLLVAETKGKGVTLLVLDEVQKVTGQAVQQCTPKRRTSCEPNAMTTNTSNTCLTACSIFVSTARCCVSMARFCEGDYSTWPADGLFLNTPSAEALVAHS